MDGAKPSSHSNSEGRSRVHASVDDQRAAPTASGRAGGASAASVVESLCRSRSRSTRNAGEMRGGDRLPGRQLAMLQEGIHEHTVLLQPVIEMRPGRGAGRADAADQLPLIDVHAGTNAFAERGQMQVVTFESAGVAKVDHVAAAAARAADTTVPADTATTGAPGRGTVVDPEVRAIGAEHRMQTVTREPGRHAGLESQRRSQEEPLQRTAVLIVKSRLGGAGLRPSQGAEIAAVGEEPRRENRPVA